jgi:Xaa-Pro aminopeptidase
MKIRIASVLAVLSILLASWAISRVVSQHVGAHAPLRISDSYAKPALLALKAVESDISFAQVRGDQLLVDRATQEKIDAADVEASTGDERALSAALRNIHMRRLIGNMARDTNRLSGKDAANAAITARESACFKPFEEALRAREAKLPKPCTDLISEK